MPMSKNLVLTFAQAIDPATALQVDAPLFTAPLGSEWELVEAIETHTVAGSDGGSVTLDIKKVSPGTAPGSGTSMLASSSTFNLKSTANTPVHKVRGSGLAATQALRTLRSGQSLCLDFTGTLTALAGMSVTILLRNMRPANNR